MELNEKEAQAVGVLAAHVAACEREDIIGAILKTGAFRCMCEPNANDGQIVALAEKLRAAFDRACEAHPKLAKLWIHPGVRSKIKEGGGDG